MRHVISKNKPARLIARGVKLLVTGIERQSKQRSFFPFDSLLRFSLLPYGGGAPTFHDEHHFIVHVMLRLQLAFGRYLDDLKAVNLLIAQTCVGRFAAPPLPVRER